MRSPASRVYAEAGLVMISPFSTSPKLTDQPQTAP
jgi:ABC-type branched-subunit amino acid transport system substrate-binding protein